MAEDRNATLRSYIHPALAVCVPLLFLQALDAILRRGIVPETAAGPAAGTAAGPAGTLVVVLLVGISRTISANVLGRERVTGAVPLLRELVVTLAACLVLLLLLTGLPFRGDISPLQPAVAWPLVLCMAQWLLTWFVQDALRARELFLRLVAGKTGHALASAAHDAGGEAGQAHEGLTKLRRFAIVLQLFALLPWIIFQAVIAISGLPSPAFAVTARVMLNVVGGVLFMAVLRGFAEEQICLGAGISREAALATRRFGAPVAGILAIFLAAVVLAGGRSLVPLSVLGRLFDWLNSLNKGGNPPIVVQDQPFELPQPDLAAGAGGEGLPTIQTSPLLAEILRIAGIVIAVAAAAGFIWFVVRPLFRKGLFASARRFHPLRAAARAVTGLLRFLAGLPAGVARWLRTPGKGFASIPRAILDGLREAAASNAGAARTREKAARASRSRAVREFRRLSRWGERSGVSLSPAEGPMEYARRLLQRVPAREAAIREAALVFERLVYSPDPEPKGERILAQLVDGIIR